MVEEKTVYVCTECGGISPRWLGKCPSCGAWNTPIEQLAGVGGRPGYQHRVPQSEVGD